MNRERNDLRLDPVGDGVVGTESERRVTALFRDRKRVKDAEADFIRVQESGKFVAEPVLDQDGILMEAVIRAGNDERGDDARVGDAPVEFCGVGAALIAACTSARFAKGIER